MSAQLSKYELVRVEADLPGWSKVKVTSARGKTTFQWWPPQVKSDRVCLLSHSQDQDRSRPVALPQGAPDG